MSTENSESLRSIPQVEKLLQHDEIKNFIPVIGHPFVVNIIRSETDLYREEMRSGVLFNEEQLVKNIKVSCKKKAFEKLSRIINGTGVVLHTNLGRAPISGDILKSLAESLSGYCNLEYHIPSESRGRRGGFAEQLICELTGAEDALIVNNNASSVFLILNKFAKRKEAVISRSELIQIGGGFRIPDIMHQSGARMVEVGTTNITSIDDFKKVINEKTSVIFSAHQSNFRIEGFTKSPGLKDLSALKSESIILVRDLGSGNLNFDPDLPQPFEPTVNSELSQGADLVCFSGDKLLGGCQAGIIIGRRDLVAKLRKHPLMRMIRVDKITYFILQETLIKYANSSRDEIQLWNIIYQDKKKIQNRINRLMKQINKTDAVKITKTDTASTFGGGAMPGIEFGSHGIRIEVAGMKPGEIYTRFLSSSVPVLGKIVDGFYTIDFSAVFDNDVSDIASIINTLSGS